MAAGTIAVAPSSSGIFHVDHISEESRAKARELLQLNHEKYHAIWEVARNLHNHQVHYLLTDLTLGASPQQLQKAFDENTEYMRPLDAGDEDRAYTVTEDNFDTSLGDEDRYSALVRFFKPLIEQNGWQAVLKEYLFSRTWRGETVLARMFEGAMHGAIHLGFVVEFEEPALVAEGLANIAVHRVECGKFLHEADLLARNKPTVKSNDRLRDFFDRARQDSTIAGAECFKGGSFDRNGEFYLHLPLALVQLAAEYKLDPFMDSSDLHLRTVEMLNVTAYYVSMAQRKGRLPRFDFFMIHCVTSSIFHSVWEVQDWLDIASKVRLLEWAVRMYLLLYVCQGAPEPQLHLVASYQSSQPEMTSWSQIITKAKEVEDDGHVVKLIRSLNHICVMSEPLLTDEKTVSKLPIDSKQLWLKIANMVLDSVDGIRETRQKWLRGAGSEAGWTTVPEK